MTLKDLYKFLIISFFLIVIVPSIVYFTLIFYMHIQIPFYIAVYIMIFSGLTNMEIWTLSIWTAHKTLQSVSDIKEKAEYYESLAKSFGIVLPNREEKEIEEGDDEI